MSNKFLVSHPGVFIKDAINELGLSKDEFALQSGLSASVVSDLISGNYSITFEVASKLASFFGNSIEGWLNLQLQYDNQI